MRMETFSLWSLIKIDGLINLKVAERKRKGINLTRSGNLNSVELHIAENGDDMVNVTFA